MVKMQNLGEIKDFNDYLKFIEAIIGNTKKSLPLYRGQSSDYALLPSIARGNPNKDTLEIETKVIEELKRRSEYIIGKNLESDLDILVFLQHHGLKTRLLDWTSNPLVALWFACSNEKKMEQNSFVYIFLTQPEDTITGNIGTENIWNLTSTKVLKAKQNNNRIIAQSGWFTIHKYSNKVKKFVNLSTNNIYGDRIFKLEVPASQKKDILKKLDIFGINFQSLFPDIEGLCKQINWEISK